MVKSSTGEFKDALQRPIVSAVGKGEGYDQAIPKEPSI